MAEAFSNEPPIDFSRRNNRERFGQTLEKVRDQFKERSPRRSGGAWLDSVNPANPKEIVGRVRVSSIDQAQEAIDQAARFFPEWRGTAAEERAEILYKAADIMRERRWELAAWEVFEVGKGWREADADVIEAIDYLRLLRARDGCAWRRRAKPNNFPAKPMFISMSRAASPRSLRRGIFRWRFSPA